MGSDIVIDFLQRMQVSMSSTNVFPTVFLPKSLFLNYDLNMTYVQSLRESICLFLILLISLHVGVMQLVVHSHESIQAVGALAEYTIHNTPPWLPCYGCGRLLLGRMACRTLLPIGEALALNNELGAGERLGQDVCPHDLGGASDYSDAAFRDTLLDPEVANVDVAAALRAWAASVDERHRRIVVLVDDGGRHRLALCDDEAPEADHFG